MSLVHMLDAEATGDEATVAHAARGELERMLSGQATMLLPVEPELAPQAPAASPSRFRPTVVPLPVRPAASEPMALRPAPTGFVRPAAPQPAPSPAPAVSPLPAPQTFRPTTLVDELTGIGGPLALRRDVMLESSLPTPSGPRFALISIDVHPVAEVRERRGDDVADQLFKTLVEALRASVRSSDTIYRSGPDELTLLLRGRNPGAGDRSRAELESALRQALSDRGLPLVRLATATRRPRPPGARA